MYELNISRLFAIVFYMSLMQCIVMTLFSKSIIYLIYGKAYYPSADVLRLVVWYVTYSYIGQVRNIWILAEGKQKYLWRINLVGALLNVVLNALIIPFWGLWGAALTSFITQFFTNFVLGFFVKPIKACNKLMLKGMSPKFVTLEIGNLVRKK